MTYWDWEEIEAWCRALAARLPQWFAIEEVGQSREGRPLILVTVGGEGAEDRPGFWLDGGTHCSEWTGVMACVATLKRWAEAIEAGDTARFEGATAYVMPCISPDGYAAMRAGAPFIRSTMRPPRDGRPRVGLEPQDLDGDGQVRMMRWKSEAGPWIFDSDNPAKARHRTLDDDPSEAWFLCDEGAFLEWDGVRWVTASLRNGLDLNRNFPTSWAPFEMFGMDAGAYSLSEPESRAVVEAFAARPRIACALTNHTYTGCLLTQPYRDPSPLPDTDIRFMERLATQAAEGTGYRVMRVVPDFTYDPKKSIVGVWADAMTTTFGVPGYTLELWDPYGHNGVEIDDPAAFFRRPDLEKVGAMLDGFFEKDPSCVRPWKAFQHPQLGSVELGGLDYMHTVRNPPLSHLDAELEKGVRIADRLLASVPKIVARLDRDGDQVQLVLENRGYLSTGSLEHAEKIGSAPPITVELEGTCLQGDRIQSLGWLLGWGDLQLSSASTPIYSGLPLGRGVQAVARWTVEGPVTVRWDAGRGGCGVLTA